MDSKEFKQTLKLGKWRRPFKFDSLFMQPEGFDKTYIVGKGSRPKPSYCYSRPLCFKEYFSTYADELAAIAPNSKPGTRNIIQNILSDENELSKKDLIAFRSELDKRNFRYKHKCRVLFEDSQTKALLLEDMPPESSPQHLESSENIPSRPTSKQNYKCGSRGRPSTSKVCDSNNKVGNKTALAGDLGNNEEMNLPSPHSSCNNGEEVSMLPTGESCTVQNTELECSSAKMPTKGLRNKNNIGLSCRPTEFKTNGEKKIKMLKRNMTKDTNHVYNQNHKVTDDLATLITLDTVPRSTVSWKTNQRKKNKINTFKKNRINKDKKICRPDPSSSPLRKITESDGDSKNYHLRQNISEKQCETVMNGAILCKESEERSKITTNVSADIKLSSTGTNIQSNSGSRPNQEVPTIQILESDTVGNMSNISGPSYESADRDTQDQKTPSPEAKEIVVSIESESKTSNEVSQDHQQASSSEYNTPENLFKIPEGPVRRSVRCIFNQKKAEEAKKIKEEELKTVVQSKGSSREPNYDINRLKEIIGEITRRGGRNKRRYKTVRGQIFVNTTKKLGKRNLIARRNFVLSFRIHKPFARNQGQKGVRPGKCQQELELLNFQTLADLQKKISCETDFQEIIGNVSNYPRTPIKTLAKDKYKGSMFYINNTFYVDTQEGAEDYSVVIREWAEKHSVNVGETKPMDSVKIEDLQLRMGYPYVYLHQGFCEHLVIISDAKLVVKRNSLYSSDYPNLTKISRSQTTYCIICTRKAATWVIIGSHLLINDVSYVCENCFFALNYVNNQKVGDFKAYRYKQRALLFY